MPLLGFKFNLIRIVKGIVREARSYVFMYEANTIAQSSALRQLVQYGRRSRQFHAPSSKFGRNPVAPHTAEGATIEP
jgi:hypothetical protein